jgi:type II secretory pathway component GspD/PulD (secretin)
MIAKFLPLVLIPAALLGQPIVDGETARLFRFVHAATSEERQEIGNTVRSVAEVQRIIVDHAAAVMAARGTPAQLEFVAWIFGELDHAPRNPTATAMDSYQVQGDRETSARAFFLAHAENPRALQDIVNTVRNVADVQRMMSYQANGVIVLRGSAEQVDLAGWIIRNLDRPAGAQSDAKPLEYTYNDTSSRPATAVRMFRITRNATSQALQELTTAVRSIADVQRVTINSEIATLTLRGTPSQAGMAAWLIDEMDRKPAAGGGQ